MKTKLIEISEGRDAGKVFLIEEMPVRKLEKWCLRALIGMMGAEIPSDIAEVAKVSSGAALMAAFQSGLKSLPWDVAESLYDQLLPHIYVLPNGDGAAKIPLRDSTIDAHVHDLLTMAKLRATVLELSLGFSKDGSN